MKLFTVLCTLILLSASCEADVMSENNEQSGQESVQSNYPQGYQQVVVEEVIQVSGYTYLKVKEKDQSIWLSVPTIDAKMGDLYYHKGGMLMKNFESKSLNRTFESILFLEEIRKDPNKTAVGKNDQSDLTQIKSEDNQVPPAQGGITIHELMSNRQKYDQKEVTIRGKVVKYNAAIMNTNWIHIQDGTGLNGAYDLTITSTAKVNIGDTIIVKGEVTLEKDFGAGYKYEVIIENASVTID